MTLFRCLRAGMLVLASWGMLLPPPSLMAMSGSSAESARVVDIELGSGGILTGQVVHPQGAASADVSVLVKSNGKRIVQISTDRGGRFYAFGLRGGSYEIDVKGKTQHVRLWKNGTAPPSASSSLMVVTAAPVTAGEGPLTASGPAMTVLGLGLLIGGAIWAADAVRDSGS